jgi:predicted ABC-class ATPase
MERLEKALTGIDGQNYKEYKKIKGEYQFDDFNLIIDHVQGDPFAVPSKVRVRVNQNIALFPMDTYYLPVRSKGLRDFLARELSYAAKKIAKGSGSRGTGHSGEISIQEPGQEILERSSVVVNKEYIEARLKIALPAYGRRISAQQAIAMFFKELPKIVKRALLFVNINETALYCHIETSQDADALRDQLEASGLISFVADGAILPRASGINPRPLKSGHVVPFKSPEIFRVEMQLPNRGKVTGMGIPKGITLIVGGGYHGKSTLLKAMEAGVYNHVPGDGREFVVTVPQAMKIRATDGRNIASVNISPFIDNLPFDQDTTEFSTENASGSTSQAANIIEAVEIGATMLLIDEDTSATNFMIRDHRMQELIAKEKEPITPFIDKARQLYEELDVSTLLVIGGSGDYFSVADHVIGMKDYLPVDMTTEAKKIAVKYKSERQAEGGDDFGVITPRIPIKESLDPSRGRKDVKIATKGLHTIAFGTYTIDISDLEQLVDSSQTRAIADAIYYATKYMTKQYTLKEVVENVMADIKEKGFDLLDRIPSGDYASFRSLELAGAINRLRSIKFILQQSPLV